MTSLVEIKHGPTFFFPARIKKYLNSGRLWRKATGNLRSLMGLFYLPVLCTSDHTHVFIFKLTGVIWVVTSKAIFVFLTDIKNLTDLSP